MTYNYPYVLPELVSSSYTLSSPIVHDLTHVRWVNDSTVFILSERRLADALGQRRRRPGRRSTARPTARAGSTDWIEDVFVLPSTRTTCCSSAAGHRVFLSTNGLTSTAASAVRCAATASASTRTTPRGCTSAARVLPLRLLRGRRDEPASRPTMMNGTTSSRAFDALGSTALGAGNAGYIFNSIDPAEAYLQPADGTLATNDWRAADLAQPSTGALGGAQRWAGRQPTNSTRCRTSSSRRARSAGNRDRAAGPARDLHGQSRRQRRRLGHRPGRDLGGRSDSDAVGSGRASRSRSRARATTRSRSASATAPATRRSASTNISVNAPPIDDTDPTGTISGPAFAVAGQSATFTASASDSGSGIDPSSFSLGARLQRRRARQQRDDDVPLARDRHRLGELRRPRGQPEARPA